MCYRCTLVPVLPSMPWARPQAAGCAGSRGSDLTGRPSRERSPCGARSGEGEGHRWTLVPVLPSMPWARPQAAGCAGSRGSDLTGRPSRERSPCGARSGEGEDHRWTLVPVLPSMPWTRPQAAGCAGSRGSDCQNGHRGREAPAVQGAEREKVTDALSYRSYPRCRPWPSPAE